MTSTEKPISEKQAMKKRLIHNVIELVIGLILLGLCYAHLQTHPAERISFFSGYKVVYQQTEIFFQNLFGHNGEWLRQKYNLESYYQAMVTLSEEKPCVDPDLIVDLHETYEALQNEPKATLEHTLQGYLDKQREFDEELKKECPKDNIQVQKSGIEELDIGYEDEYLELDSLDDFGESSEDIQNP